MPISLNWTNLYQYACVPVPNQSYIYVNLINFYDSKPTLLTWPSSSSKIHIWATKRLHILSTKLFPNTLNSMTPQPTSITIKEYLIFKHDILQPKKLNQEIKDLTNYVKLNQYHKLLYKKSFFTLLKSSQQIKQISSK